MKECCLGIALFFLASVAAALPASARPRDETMSNVYRCAVIGDTRLWLDCYYGAAQPVRASLGMQPAHAAQIKLLAAPPGSSMPPADVGARDQVVFGATRCTSFSDEGEWLNCYYAAAQPIRVLLGLSPTSQASAAAPQFGLRPPPHPDTSANADHFETRMASYSFDRYGLFKATLDNGQVWYQISGDDSFAHWEPPATKYVVRISKGILGSYNFEVKGERPPIQGPPAAIALGPIPRETPSATPAPG